MAAEGVPADQQEAFKHRGGGVSMAGPADDMVSTLQGSKAVRSFPVIPED